jgi:hypothetical protein
MFGPSVISAAALTQGEHRNVRRLQHVDEQSEPAGGGTQPHGLSAPHTHSLAQGPVQEAEHHCVQAPQLPLELGQAALAANGPVIAQLQAAEQQQVCARSAGRLIIGTQVHSTAVSNRG